MSVSVAQEYLQIAEPVHVDASVDSYVYREYYPIVGTGLNNVNSEIRIVVENRRLHPPCKKLRQRERANHKIRRHGLCGRRSHHSRE